MHVVFFENIIKHKNILLFSFVNIIIFFTRHMYYSILKFTVLTYIILIIYNVINNNNDLLLTIIIIFCISFVVFTLCVRMEMVFFVC